MNRRINAQFLVSCALTSIHITNNPHDRTVGAGLSRVNPAIGIEKMCEFDLPPSARCRYGNTPRPWMGGALLRRKEAADMSKTLNLSECLLAMGQELQA